MTPLCLWYISIGMAEDILNFLPTVIFVGHPVFLIWKFFNKSVLESIISFS